MNRDLWQTLNGLCKTNRRVQERVNELYGRTSFPYKIRSKFADWIEEQDWESLDTDDEFSKKKAENLYKELVMKIDSTEDVLQKEPGYDLEKTLDLGRAKDSLKKAFDSNYSTFVEVIRRCLGEERLLVQSCEEDNNELKRKVRCDAAVDVETIQIQQKLAELHENIALIGHKIQDVQKKQEKFQLEYMEKEEKIKQLTKELAKHKHPEIEGMLGNITREMGRGSQENFNNRKEMTNSLVLATNSMNEVLQLIWKEIDKWNFEQKQEITALTKPVDGSLDKLDKLCNEIGDALIKMVQHLENALLVFQVIRYSNDTCEEDLQSTRNGVIGQFLTEHLKRVLVVERSIPDRVLKVSSGKSLGFSMSLRLLGGSGLGLSFAPPKVMMSLFHEKSIPPGNEHTTGVCQILNGQERTFAVNRGTNSFTAHFHSVQLKNIKRPDRGKNEELVTEHKYAFVFYTSVTVCRQLFQMKVISLPIILTSQTSQEIMAKGTLIWHAAFSESNSFEYKETVPWCEVARVLTALFQQNTGRALTPEHLLYLAKMAFRHKDSRRLPEATIGDFDKKLISEKLVIRDRLNGRDFSFWKWFYACMNLVIYHVKKEWQDGRIYGFISKEDAKRKLKDAPCGTFLLRFSESNVENSQKSDICGYLTVAVMEIDPESGQKKLFHVKDYLSPKEIHEKGLAPILDAMEVVEYADNSKKKRLLQFLYPDKTTKFEDIFGAYIKQKESSDDGYRRGKYSIEIFLTDEQVRKGRQDSIDGSVCDTGSCPPSVQMTTPVSSPLYDINEWPQECAPGQTYDMQQLLLTMPMERQVAAVRPSFVPTQVPMQTPMQYGQLEGYQLSNELFGSAADIDLNPFMQGGQILDDRHLEEMLILRTDSDGDLVIAPDVHSHLAFP